VALKGIVESNKFPLNISIEILQKNRIHKVINKNLVKNCHSNVHRQDGVRRSAHVQIFSLKIESEDYKKYFLINFFIVDCKSPRAYSFF